MSHNERDQNKLVVRLILCVYVRVFVCASGGYPCSFSSSGEEAQNSWSGP